MRRIILALLLVLPSLMAQTAGYGTSNPVMTCTGNNCVLRDWKSVMDFGTVGDGVADDSSHFQSACTSVASGTVQIYVPRGTYLLNSSPVCTGRTVTWIFATDASNTGAGVLPGTTYVMGTNASGSLSGMTAAGIPIAATATTVTSSTTPGTNQGTYYAGRSNTTQGTAAALTELQAGDCASPTTITGAATTATILYSDVVGCTVRHDIAGSAGVTITIPTPTTLNNAHPIFIYENDSASADTLTPTTFTISLGNAAAAATLSVPKATTCKVQLDPVNASTWKADCHNNATGPGEHVFNWTIIQTGDAKTYIPVFFACTIYDVDVTADQSGTFAADVDRHNAAIPNTTTDKISGTDGPSLSAAQINLSHAPSSWGSTAIASGDVLDLNVTTFTTVTNVHVQLRCH